SGAAALIRANHPTLGPKEIRTIMQLSVDAMTETGTSAVGKLGAGRLNLARAMEIAPGFVSEEGLEAESKTEDRDFFQKLSQFDGNQDDLDKLRELVQSRELSELQVVLKAIIVKFAQDFADPVVLLSDLSSLENMGQFYAFVDEIGLINQLYQELVQLNSGEPVKTPIEPVPESLPDSTTPAKENDSANSSVIVVAPEKGAPPVVRVFSPSGKLLSSFDAYDQGMGAGIRLALGDVDGDGEHEIVTVPGFGGGPQVRIFETNGTLVSQFNAFDSGQHSGLFVAVGDIDSNGLEDVVVSQDAGGQGEVRMFDHQGTQLGSFLPFDSTRLSVRVAVGDTDADGNDEIVVSLGPGAAPRVRTFSNQGQLIREFFAYAQTYDRGVFVAMGDLDGDGDKEIVTGTDNGGGPHVRTFDYTGRVLSSFFAYDEMFRGGVRLSLGSFGGATDSIITAAGPGGGPHIRVFNSNGQAIGGFFSDQEVDRNGINVAAWAL
ncbi:hypothetical protein ACFLZY_02270, partial [Patescibacteria group bacterium]